MLPSIPTRRWSAETSSAPSDPFTGSCFSREFGFDSLRREANTYPHPQPRTRDAESSDLERGRRLPSQDRVPNTQSALRRLSTHAWNRHLPDSPSLADGPLEIPDARVRGTTTRWTLCTEAPHARKLSTDLFPVTAVNARTSKPNHRATRAPNRRKPGRLGTASRAFNRRRDCRRRSRFAGLDSRARQGE